MRHGRIGENSEEMGKIAGAVPGVTNEGRVIASNFRFCINYYKVHQLDCIASNLDLMQNGDMRTTITLDDDVHEFAAYYANAKGITLSAAMNELVRKAETAPVPEPKRYEFERSPNGLPLLPRTGRTITAEMVKQLSEDDFE